MVCRLFKLRKRFFLQAKEKILHVHNGHQNCGRVVAPCIKLLHGPVLDWFHTKHVSVSELGYSKFLCQIFHHPDNSSPLVYLPFLVLVQINIPKHLYTCLCPSSSAIGAYMELFDALGATITLCLNYRFTSSYPGLSQVCISSCLNVLKP